MSAGRATVNRNSLSAGSIALERLSQTTDYEELCSLTKEYIISISKHHENCLDGVTEAMIDNISSGFVSSLDKILATSTRIEDLIAIWEDAEDSEKYNRLEQIYKGLGITELPAGIESLQTTGAETVTGATSEVTTEDIVGVVPTIMTPYAVSGISARIEEPKSEDKKEEKPSTTEETPVKEEEKEPTIIEEEEKVPETPSEEKPSTTPEPETPPSNNNSNNNNQTNTGENTNNSGAVNNTPSTGGNTNSGNNYYAPNNNNGGGNYNSGASSNTPTTSTGTPNENASTTTPSAPESDAGITDNTGETLDVISIDKDGGKSSASTSSNDGGSVVPTILGVGVAGAAAVAGAKILHDKKKKENEYTYEEDSSGTDNSFANLESYTGDDTVDTTDTMSPGKYRAGSANNLVLEGSPSDIKIDESVADIPSQKEELE